MKKYAVIVAAGSGSRMGNKIPKQFLPILGKPLLLYTLATFAEAYSDIRIVLVMHPEFIDKAKEILSQAGYSNVTVVAGAETRFGSVKRGLEVVEEDSVVFVHDGVRCLLTKELIYRCYEAALEKGNAIPATPAIDSLRVIKEIANDNLTTETSNEWIDRNLVRLVQTPQTFRAHILKYAYAAVSGEDFTDEAAVIESVGEKINLVEGEATNIKVTHPVDLLIAEMILNERKVTIP